MLFIFGVTLGPTCAALTTCDSAPRTEFENEECQGALTLSMLCWVCFVASMSDASPFLLA